jgi:hypothetical protein
MLLDRIAGRHNSNPNLHKPNAYQISFLEHRGVMPLLQMACIALALAILNLSIRVHGTLLPVEKI